MSDRVSAQVVGHVRPNFSVFDVDDDDDVWCVSAMLFTTCLMDNILGKMGDN